MKIFEISKAETISSVHAQLIWNNKVILINRTLFYDCEFHSTGLTSVKDLFYNNDCVKAFGFWSKAGIRQEKYFLVGAIPKSWKLQIRTENTAPFEDH